MRSTRNIALLAAAAAFGMASTGCATTASNRDTGGAIGAAVGAGVGAVVGNNTGSTVRGAIVGAVVGGAAGAIIGHQMDQQAKKIDQTIPGATVERMGEGIAVVFESGLLFDFDSDRIKPTAASNLTSLANSLKEYPSTEVVIVGHTDAQGTFEYNQSLSERRAQAAANYIVSQGVARARIRARGLGETEPVASNDTEAGRAQNRRVEIAIFADEALKAQAKAQAGVE